MHRQGEIKRESNHAPRRKSETREPPVLQSFFYFFFLLLSFLSFSKSAVSLCITCQPLSIMKAYSLVRGVYVEFSSCRLIKSLSNNVGTRLTQYHLASKLLFIYRPTVLHVTIENRRRTTRLPFRRVSFDSAPLLEKNSLSSVSLRAHACAAMHTLLA